MNSKESKIHVVFDGPPGPEGPRFIEVETPDGKGLSFGEWKQRGLYWVLEIPNTAALEAENKELREALIELTRTIRVKNMPHGGPVLHEPLYGEATRKYAKAALAKHEEEK